MRVIDETFYRDWSQKYENLKFQSMNQHVKIPAAGDTSDDTIAPFSAINEYERLQKEIESGLFLLGASALEDKL